MATVNCILTGQEKGVSDVVGIENGGTGAVSAPSAVGNLVRGLSEETTMADGDYIPLSDTSASGIGKKISKSNLKSDLGVSTNTTHIEALNKYGFYPVKTGSSSIPGEDNSAYGRFLVYTSSVPEVTGKYFISCTIQLPNITTPTAFTNCVFYNCWIVLRASSSDKTNTFTSCQFYNCVLHNPTSANWIVNANSCTFNTCKTVGYIKVIKADGYGTEFQAKELAFQTTS